MSPKLRFAVYLTGVGAICIGLYRLGCLLGDLLYGLLYDRN